MPRVIFPLELTQLIDLFVNMKRSPEQTLNILAIANIRQNTLKLIFHVIHDSQHDKNNKITERLQTSTLMGNLQINNVYFEEILLESDNK